ncbi:MAG TPA: hypothetical protein VK363_10930 [Pyrinomonadaceae bacterium]|nr:hypothetical protein [Pyrinomonadaceae bacterium]
MTRKLAATVLLMLCMSSIVYAQQGKGNRAWLNGTWEGTGYQIDTDSTWTMRLTARRGGKYLIEYPSLNCGGRWRLVRINSKSAVFRESITSGQDACVDKGRVVIERLNGRQIAYRFSHRGATDISASAILNRKK